MKDIKLWNSVDEEMAVIHRLNNIVRYNTKNKVNPETVSSHSFFVSYFVVSICKTFEICDKVKLLALEAATLHDVPEVFINDITYDCKCLIPQLEKVIEPFERNIIKQISSSAERVLFDPQTDDEKLASAIVWYADVLSVKQYAMSEVELGNTGFKDVVESTEARLENKRNILISAIGAAELKEERKRDIDNAKK